MPRVPRPDQRRLDVRVPVDLFDAISKAAEADEDSSINREVIVLLREALAARAKRKR